MAIKKVKVEESEVEILNSSENKNPKITRIKAEENQSSGNPFEQMFGGNGEIPDSMKNNPMFKMMGSLGEIKKIKPYFFFSIVSGLIALFALREYLGISAIVFGALDIWKGSRLTKTASYFGIFLGLVALILHFK